ncbi:MAG: hypothetical protein WCP46_04815 [Alphaproteobacteria bacterium]
MEVLNTGQQVCLGDLQKQFCKKANSSYHDIEIVQHGLEQYNQLIPQHSQVAYHA